MVGRTDQLGRQTRDALAHLHDPPYLQTHPLTTHLGRDPDPVDRSVGRALQKRLLDAIGLMSAPALPGRGPPAAPLARLLTLRYVDGLGALDVARQLGVSRVEYYREHGRAVAAIASLLRDRWRLGGSPDRPPSASMADARRELPVAVTSLVGRAAELALAGALLERTRLLTLIGAGGVGKTRLALELAAQVRPMYPDGAWFVDLAPLTDPALVPHVVLATVGVRQVPGQEAVETLEARLRRSRALLVLDNCEHLLSACAAVADAILRGCPQVRVVATSRAVLGAAGETVWRVPSLGLPSPDAPPVPHALERSDAVRLFVERARAARAGGLGAGSPVEGSGFALTPENAAAVARICRRLDGIPLALELAAARVRGMTAEEIADRLDDPFRLLTGGSRGAPTRHQTLRATMDWSHDLLSGHERVLLRRLAVFVGGWDLEAAEAVCGWPPLGPEAALGLLLQLVDQSLVLADDQPGGTRYRLLEPIRQYALGHLRDSQEEDAARTRHANHVRELGERATHALFHHDGDGDTARPAERRAPRTGIEAVQPVDWIAFLGRDAGNARAALDWLAGRGGAAAAEDGLRMASALMALWYGCGHTVEGMGRLRALLGSPEAALPSRARARALHGAGVLAKALGEKTESRRYFEECAVVGRLVGEEFATVRALQALATSRAEHQEALDLARRAGNVHSIVWGLVAMGCLALAEGDPDAAVAAHDEALAVARASHYRRGMANALEARGRVALRTGMPGEAEALYARSLALYREMGDRIGEYHAMQGVGLAALEQGDWPRAQRLLEECLRSQWETRDLPYLAETFDGLACGAAMRAATNGDVAAARRAVWLAGTARAVRETYDQWHAPLSPPPLERWLAQARVLLRGGAAAAFREGQAATLEEAVAYGQGGS